MNLNSLQNDLIRSKCTEHLSELLKIESSTSHKKKQNYKGGSSLTRVSTAATRESKGKLRIETAKNMSARRPFLFSGRIKREKNKALEGSSGKSREREEEGGWKRYFTGKMIKSTSSLNKTSHQDSLSSENDSKSNANKAKFMPEETKGAAAVTEKYIKHDDTEAKKIRSVFMQKFANIYETYTKYYNNLNIMFMDSEHNVDRLYERFLKSYETFNVSLLNKIKIGEIFSGEKWKSILSQFTDLCSRIITFENVFYSEYAKLKSNHLKLKSKANLQENEINNKDKSIKKLYYQI